MFLFDCIHSCNVFMNNDYNQLKNGLKIEKRAREHHSNLIQEFSKKIKMNIIHEEKMKGTNAKEIRSIQREDLVNELIKHNASSDMCELLNKTYVKQLDDSWAMSKDEFSNILKSLPISKSDSEQLMTTYKQQRASEVPPINENKYDSLLFLSDINQSELNGHSTNTCFQNKTIDLKKIINHLKKTERMDIILYNNRKLFHKQNTIYFDDEDHKNDPKLDVLYKRINDYYFVSNNEYFQKCSDYYFKLYSNIFALFDLHQITMKYHSGFSTDSETKMSLNTGPVNAGGSIQQSQKNDADKDITMLFEKKECKIDLLNRFNECASEYEEIKHLKDKMPPNLKKPMYHIPSSILGLIRNYLNHKLIKFEQEQTIENTDIKKVECSLDAKFDLSTSLGLFGSQSNTKYILQTVIYTIEFFPNLPTESEQPLCAVCGSCSTDDVSNSQENTGLLSHPTSPIFTNSNHMETEIPVTSSCSSPIMEKSPTMKKSSTMERSEPENIQEIKWISASRYDDIPENAISPGSSKNDGKVYVGRINIGPGKVNLDKGKVWNFWVQNTGSSQSGQILVCDYQHKWVRITRNDQIPENAVYSGKDRRNDHVWVGRSVDNEPGKITCINNNERPLKMANLWCHSTWSSFQTAYILTVVGCEEDTYLKILPSE